MSILGERLIQARKNKGFTQDYVAKIIGATYQTVSNYERGTRDPDTETLSKLAVLFETSVDYLVGNTDDPSPRRDVREVFTPEVLREHGVEYAEVSDYLKKNGITDREAVEMLKDIDEFRKRMIAKYVEKN